MMSGDERKCIEDQSGRTLLEMLAVLGIIVILTAISGWGVNVALNYYRAYRISSSAQDRTILVAQKTRSRKNTKSGYENIINGDVMGSYPIEYVPSFSSAEYSIHDSKAFQISAFNKNVCNYLINIGGLKQIKQQMKMPVIINGKDINDNPICSDNESLNNLVIPFSERSGNHGSTPDDDIPDDVSDTDCAVPGGTIGNGEYYGCGKCVNGGLEKTTHGITDSDCQVCDSDFTVTNLNKELGNCQICVNGRKETKTDCCVADSDCTGSCEKCSGNKCVSNIAYKSVKKHNSNGCCINQNIGWCQNDSAAEPTDDCSTDNINACQVCDSSGNVSSVSGCCLANSDCTGSCEICNTSTHRCVSNLGTKPAKRLNANGCCITQSVPWCPGSSLPADTCTTDNINACQTCDSSGNISAVPGCCLADSDCSGACTKCDSENHQCVSNIASKKVKKLNANGCCMEETVEWCRSSAAEPQDECTASNINACQVCDATGNVLPVEGCCLSDADCTGGCEKCENNVCQSKQTDKVVWRTNDVGCCVEDTMTWCPIDPNADEPVSNCAELNNQIDACHICKDGAVVQVEKCLCHTQDDCGGEGSDYFCNYCSGASYDFATYGPSNGRQGQGACTKITEANSGSSGRYAWSKTKLDWYTSENFCTAKGMRMISLSDLNCPYATDDYIENLRQGNFGYCCANANKAINLGCSGNVSSVMKELQNLNVKNYHWVSEWIQGSGSSTQPLVIAPSAASVTADSQGSCSMTSALCISDYKECDDGTIIPAGEECPTTCGYALSSVQADCGYNFDTSYNADCSYNWENRYEGNCSYDFQPVYESDCQYTYTSHGDGSVTVSGSGCSDSQYCAIFWNQASWTKGSVPTVQSSDKGTLYGRCQALSEYVPADNGKTVVSLKSGCNSDEYCAILWRENQWEAGSVPHVQSSDSGTLYGRCQALSEYTASGEGASMTVATPVQDCPADKYCAIFWNKESWTAGSVPTVQSSDKNTLYGRCQAMSEYVPGTTPGGTTVTATQACPANQYCAVFWTAPTWTTPVPNVSSSTTGTVYGKCQALSMNIPNTTVGAAVINTQKICAEGEYCSISCSDKDCASNITASATDNVYGQCVAP